MIMEQRAEIVKRFRKGVDRFGTTRSHFSLIGLCPRYFIGPSNLCRIGFHFIGPSSLCRIGFPCLIAH
ncbi:hypothetical protein T02_13103 [Trichinella nativa]|uniref:Uncharacterized protein n=1 Tax=Trichinella nativa TaxID=6335 RepID=A0A0V1KTR5_9BILA|nr:hypothetical protein T02_13103 [Trichinella nativa]